MALPPRASYNSASERYSYRQWTCLTHSRRVYVSDHAYCSHRRIIEINHYLERVLYLPPSPSPNCTQPDLRPPGTDEEKSRVLRFCPDICLPPHTTPCASIPPPLRVPTPTASRASPAHKRSSGTQPKARILQKSFHISTADQVTESCGLRTRSHMATIVELNN